MPTALLAGHPMSYDPTDPDPLRHVISCVKPLGINILIWVEHSGPRQFPGLLALPRLCQLAARYDGVVSMRGTGWTHYEKVRLMSYRHVAMKTSAGAPGVAEACEDDDDCAKPRGGCRKPGRKPSGSEPELKFSSKALRGRPRIFPALRQGAIRASGRHAAGPLLPPRGAEIPGRLERALLPALRVRFRLPARISSTGCAGGAKLELFSTTSWGSEPQMIGKTGTAGETKPSRDREGAREREGGQPEQSGWEL